MNLLVHEYHRITIEILTFGTMKDRCNVHAKDRKMWITDAKSYCADGQKYTFEAIFMDTPIGTN
jgi:hypothetical protein